MWLSYRCLLLTQCQIQLYSSLQIGTVVQGSKWDLIALDPNSDPKTDRYILWKTGPQPAPASGIRLLVEPQGSFPPATVRCIVASSSRIVFDASALPPTPVNLAALLNAIGALPLCLPHDGIVQPSAYETALECPARLILAPLAGAHFQHSGPAVSMPVHGTASSSAVYWSELWHTRLSRLRIIRPLGANWIEGGQVRAIWALDPGFSQSSSLPNHSNAPFRMSLDACDRYNLVHLTSQASPGVQAPVEARRLMLSSLGAWADLHGRWDHVLNEQFLTVSEWRHQATLGRDHYVRIVYEGFLFPFGHRASLVKITERKFHPKHQGNPAYLRQRMFLLVREPEKSYDFNNSMLAQHPVADLSNHMVKPGRAWPFSRIEIKTVATPDLDDPANSCLENRLQSLFLPMTGKEPFQFHVVAWDLAGQAVEFTCPLLFVAGDAATDAGLISGLCASYNLSSGSTGSITWSVIRQCPLNGQPLALAAFAGQPAPQWTTSLPARNITLGAITVPAAPSGVAPFLPFLLKACVDIPDLQHIAGAQDPVTVAYPEAYLLDIPNAAQVYARIITDYYSKTTIALDFNQKRQRAGALAGPSMAIAALTGVNGPAAQSPSNTTDLADLLDGNFNPDIFSALPATLFGVIPLKDILPGGLKLENAPKFLHGTDASGAPTLTLSWSQRLLTKSPLVIESNAAGLLSIKVIIRLSQSSQPQVDIDSTLTDFKLVLGFIELDFESINFHIAPGSKPDIKVNLKKPGVSFIEPLSFISKLESLIPSDGFSDPPSLTVTEDGLNMGYHLGLPPVSVGIFNLSNVNLGAALELPFTEKAMTAGFNFAERHSPFNLSVSALGGGGFLAMQVSADGQKSLEASLEFGAHLSINLGVASGGVYAMGGIYFALEGGAAKLTGYFRLGGEVDVLGLISASIELYLALGYDSGKAYGCASITVEIDLFIFSASVDISYERRFKGSSGDPTFTDLLAPYLIHAPTGQVLYQYNHRVYYRLPISNDLYLFDPSTGASQKVPPGQPSTIELSDPYRPSGITSLNGAEAVDPWRQYCQAFAY